jgi:hypothetical protein
MHSATVQWTLSRIGKLHPALVDRYIPAATTQTDSKGTKIARQVAWQAQWNRQRITLETSIIIVVGSGAISSPITGLRSVAPKATTHLLFEFALTETRIGLTILSSTNQRRFVDGLSPQNSTCQEKKDTTLRQVRLFDWTTEAMQEVSQEAPIKKHGKSRSGLAVLT